MNQFAQELNKNMPPVYVGKFNLSLHPFSSQFNSPLFYENEGRTEILKKIAHLVEFTKLILFLQGADGLGKTTLLRQRIRQPQRNWRVCLINAKDYKDPEALMEKIALEFELKIKSNGKPLSINTFQEQLEHLHEANLTPILFIDDIEHISSALLPLLATLINCTDETQPNLRLVIAGQDIPNNLLKIIPKNEDKQDNLKYLPLPPLTEKESALYIKHRLQASGYQYKEPFNKSQARKIYLDAKGFPIYINKLADHLFSQYTLNYEKAKPMINLNEKANNQLKIVAAVLSVLVLSFIGYNLLSNGDNTTDMFETNEVTQKLEIPNINKEDSIALLEKSTPIPKPKIAQPTPKTPAPTPVVQTPEKPNKTTATQATGNLNLNVNKPVQKSAPSNKSANKSSIRGHDWINKQNPKHYTLQLIGGSNRSSAISFITKHKIEKQAAIFHTLRKNKDWYSVIYRSFSSTKAAKQASSSLPTSLRKIKPWIRPFAKVQKDMK